MKIRLTTLCISVILLCGLAFSGCGTLDRTLLRPGSQPITGTITNGAGQVIPYTWTPDQLNPELRPYYDTGKAVVNVLPTPAREVGATALAALAALAGLYVKCRNAVKKAEAVTATVVAEVDKSQDAELKVKIRNRSLLEGTAKDLHKVVKSVTTKRTV